MIRNTEDANKYYQLVNTFIDNYVESHKIHPSKLNRYLKNNSKLEKFLKRNGLSDIKNINVVINDVLEDREGMEKDGVLTFESFKFFESDVFKVLNLSQCLWKGIDKSTITHEKMLSNQFDVSLSGISVLDSNKHKFEISDINSDFEVIIFTEEEVSIICENIKDYSFNQVFNKKVDLDGVGDINLDINISDFIDEEKFKKSISQKINNQKTKEIIGWLTGCDETIINLGFIGINPEKVH